jgi:formylglycine-generating enzyme required for sulfatase activity
VDASGPNFAFYVNDALMTQVSDPDYASGQAGFYVETLDEALAHVHFDALTIRELEEEVVIAASPAAETEAPVEETPPATSPEPSEATTVSDTLPAQPTAEPPPPTETVVEVEPSPTATPEPPPPTAAEGMVLIPAGSFTMGSASGQPDEAPPHPVSLAAFFIDKFEVSNADYRQCVEAGGCRQTGSPDGFTRPGYRDDPTYNNYPVVGVTWDQAAAYCRFAGKRLPTEAEWEYAARGPDNLIWPWGNTFNPTLAAASSPDTQPVDSFSEGASPFGLHHMAGNVNEWVQDVFEANFYVNSPAQNPVNTGSGRERIFRGGSFANEDGAFYTTSRRYNKVPSFSDVDVGFRCAMDAS